MKNLRKISPLHPASLISTCFGVGKIPFAPGTWGSAVGVVWVLIALFLLGHALSGINWVGGSRHVPFADLAGFLFLAMILIAIITILFSVLFIRVYQKRTNSHDASEIVVDEVVGIWLSIAIYYTIVGYDQGSSGLHRYFDSFEVQSKFYLEFLINFIFFRFFDIVKPGPVGWADRNVKGAWGVMLDDIIAGILAGICSAIVFLAIGNYI